MPSIFVMNVPEFRPLVDYSKTQAHYKVEGPRLGYFRISGEPVLTFKRKELGVKPAVWHGLLTGGLMGKITHFDNDSLTIEGLAA